MSDEQRMLRRPLFEQARLLGALGSHAVDALGFVLEGELDEVLGERVQLADLVLEGGPPGVTGGQLVESSRICSVSPCMSLPSRRSLSPTPCIPLPERPTPK